MATLRSKLFEVTSRIGASRTRSRLTPQVLSRLATNTKNKLIESVNKSLEGTVTIPIKADVLIDTVITTTIEAPIDIILDHTNLQLSTLVAHIDETIHIKEDIDLKIDLPIAATVKAYQLVNVPVAATVPISTKVPIDHHVKITAKIAPQIEELTAPLHTVLKVPITAPIKQYIRIDTNLTIPLRQLIAGQLATLTRTSK